MEAVSALLGIVAFSATYFEACIKGLVILSKARSYRRDVSGVSLMLELELHKLHAWAVEIGLSQQPPMLLVDTQYTSIVPKVLKHLQTLVSDLDKLKHTHGLQLQETADQLLILDGDDSAFVRLGIETNDGCDHILTRIFKQRKEPWKVLKWVTFDEQKVRGLLDQVKAFIQELQQILDRTRQAKLAKAVDMLLRNAVLNSANEQDLDMIGFGGEGASTGNTVAAAARLKKQGLLLGVMDIQPAPVPPETQRQIDGPKPRLRSSPLHVIMPRYSNSDLARMRLSASHLSFETYTGSEARVLARYDNDPVLLEFKNVSGLHHDSMKDRLCKVSFFLRDLDSSFNALSCRGFVKVYDRYAYVFDLREDVSPSRALRPLPSFRTLTHLLDEARKPSLNLRMAFAITILETLLQLHTSGWLHKELRSDNILFILDSCEDTYDFLLAPIRITGYVYARADDPHEPTEPLESELNADLYRHPACLRQPRQLFRRAFDAFSVGCILLELGLWCSLSTLFQRTSGRPQGREAQSLDLMRIRHEMFLSPIGRWYTNDINDSASARDVGIRGEVVQSLEAMMGKAYARIVMQLICASGGEDGIDSAAEVEAPQQKNMLHLEIDCLEKLRTIAEVLSAFHGRKGRYPVSDSIVAAAKVHRKVQGS
ncbi:hypothetical protein LTR37_017756 [Vermiconidia calcicola]|uniref:Uncharacterized protein n=1 Tax=Vermiconidia calcicola TaxID=1690605 RepID=A0ACC3MIY3_9PEZI|nr:hypothetical protein LTR37_017756 [Vermiconidia calcicola]